MYVFIEFKEVVLLATVKFPKIVTLLFNVKFVANNPPVNVFEAILAP